MDLVCSLLSSILSDTDHDDQSDNDSDVRQSDHEKTLAKILNRKRHFSDRTLYRTYSHTEPDLKDTRWVSSETLLHPWRCEDRWWLAFSQPNIILDTEPRVFGRKKVYLIQRRNPINIAT